MDTTALLTKINKALPGAVLEKGRFGRAGLPAVWVEGRKILELARFLSGDAEIRLDWLENLVAMQMDEALVLNYFLRSTASDAALILRISLELSKPDIEVETASVSEVWPTARRMEAEIKELFGIHFTGTSQGHASTRLLPSGWVGFPLRKKYQFPKEVYGIQHSRPAQASEHS